MSKKKGWIIVSLLLAAGLFYFLLRKGGTAAAWNVLIITMDTTRADHIGAYGYRAAQTPNLDRLARQGVMFENSYSCVPLTLPSHSAFFTGRYPIANNVRNNGSYLLPVSEITLAEVLRDHGFDTRAVVAAFVLLFFQALCGFQVGAPKA